MINEKVIKGSGKTEEKDGDEKLSSKGGDKMKKIDEKYSYDINEDNVILAYRRNEQIEIDNITISAICKIESLEQQNEILSKRLVTSLATNGALTDNITEERKVVCQRILEEIKKKYDSEKSYNGQAFYSTCDLEIRQIIKDLGIEL